MGFRFIALMAVVCAALGLGIPAHAQNHGEVGVFADYFRVQSIPVDMVGVGGRVSVNVHPNIALEGELAYDFDKGFGQAFDNGTGTITLQRSGLRAFHGMFGPKFQVGTGALRAFATVKGGFVNFDVTGAGPVSGFSSAVDNLRTDNVNATFYPGVGVEAYLGPIGLRLDAGDQIYFNHGANHNVMVTFGPHIRF
jgi:hypothetical protein